MSIELEYMVIKKFYEGQHAQRSGLPYIKHIDDGLKVLDALGAEDRTKAAFCIHPIIQANESLVEALETEAHLTEDPYVAVLATEYRRVANSYLARNYTGEGDRDTIKLSPLKQVNDMLIADKIQNRFDMVHYSPLQGTDRGEELLGYFDNWLAVLLQDRDVTVEELDEAISESWSEHLGAGREE